MRVINMPSPAVDSGGQAPLKSESRKKKTETGNYSANSLGDERHESREPMRTLRTNLLSSSSRDKMRMVRKTVEGKQMLALLAHSIIVRLKTCFLPLVFNTLHERTTVVHEQPERLLNGQ